MDPKDLFSEFIIIINSINRNYLFEFHFYTLKMEELFVIPNLIGQTNYLIHFKANLTMFNQLVKKYLN